MRSAILALLLAESSQARIEYGAYGTPGSTVLPPGRPWAPIARVPAAEMTQERFEREFFNKKRPVIIVGADTWPDLHAWTFQRLRKTCGEKPADLTNHMLQYAQSLPTDELEGFRLHLLRTMNVTLEEVYREWTQKVSVGSFMDQYMGLGPHWDPGWVPPPGSAEERLQRAHAVKDYSHLADYALPPTLHAWDIAQCPEMLRDVRVPSMLVDPVSSIVQRLLPPHEAAVLNKAKIAEVFTRWLFLAPRGSRAYPAHQHAMSNELFMHMVRGRKHFVMWPPAMHDALYPLRSTASTEVQGSFGRTDTFFMAEGIDLNVTRQPLLAEAEGWEGIAERGDVAYIPCGLVHQIANVDPVLAVVTQVAGHPRCRVWDHEAGDWKTVHKDPKMEKLFEEAIGGTDEREDLDEEGGRDEVEL